MYIFPTPSEGVKGGTKMRGNDSPSEGGTKMRGNDSPSEGGHGVGCWKMRLQAALVAVVILRTFGRWDENAGKLRTFGRW